MTTEEWKPLWSGYSVSSLGRVKNRAGRVLAGTINTYGYRAFEIAGKKHKGHRLVAEAFLPKVEGAVEVNHRDGNKTHNAVENLEWVTRQRNIDHAVETGLVARGERVGSAKLNAETVKRIRARLAVGDIPKRQVARLFGINESLVRQIEKRTIWGWV